MSSVRHPKGRLPARVYWFRRGMVLTVALGLVFGLAQLLGGTGDDGQPAAEQAVTASGKQADEPTEAPIQGPVAVQTKAPKKAKKKPAPVLASPDGECLPSEVGVSPLVKKAFAGRKVTLAMRLTSTRAACTFEVSPKSLVVRISSGKDAIWSSQQCPKAIAKRQVIVRSSTPTTVPVVWSGQRSDDTGCSVSMPWARPGFYHVKAAALGSEPTDVQFELQTPPRPVITKTVKPKPKPKKKPSHSPSGAVEPDQTRG